MGGRGAVPRWAKAGGETWAGAVVARDAASPCWALTLAHMQPQEQAKNWQGRGLAATTMMQKAGAVGL